MQFFLPSRRSQVIVLALLLITATIITLDIRNFGPLQSAQNTFTDTLRPVRSGLSTVFRPITDVWNAAWNYGDLREENEDLAAELDSLKGRQLQEEAAAPKLDALNKLLEANNLGSSSNIKKIVAEVVIQPGNFQGTTLQLNKGSNSSIQKGMPVAISTGLVGRIIEVSATSSRAELITSPGFMLGVRFINSGEVFLATGVGLGQSLRVTADDTFNTVPGELVATSGIEGSAYPSDIVVGRVESIEPSKEFPRQDINIKPIVNLSSLYFVNVLIYLPEDVN